MSGDGNIPFLYIDQEMETILYNYLKLVEIQKFHAFYRLIIHHDNWVDVSFIQYVLDEVYLNEKIHE